MSKTMISRENYLQQLIQFKDTDFIKVISGVRRSGKSVLLMQYRDYLQQQGIAPENTHETDNLLHIKDNYKKILITGKYYEQTEIDGIEVIYVVDWLLQ